ncbi:sialate O-acetylesterase [Flavobacterium paronense]|uniref:Sialate O-acetylesterase n=1 Tax=Flavobacterium paronense TaxID=1392775 RepID=A0ABV5GCR3_9FLAO|nr:sialate O-acetylesterase [Flavobacterium paronense]MDN3676275.1 sialate O-acetylesterase [Flavobacterium paronense]
MKNSIYSTALFIFFLIGCGAKEKDNRTEFFPKTKLPTNKIPDKEKIWVFILAGQSNMAGRGKVEPMDTIPDSRILTINKNGNLILAKEPLHLYEPEMTGLDCGLSFGKELLKHIPDSISILLIPTAVGASSISQWINDSICKNVTLFSNFSEKVEIGKKYGTIKGILWHQGENDALKKETIEIYDKQLGNLFILFRNQIGIKNLPIFIGELGSYSQTEENWNGINKKIRTYINTDTYAYLIKTVDLLDKGDRIHFNSSGQRIIGQRFANEFINRQR